MVDAESKIRKQRMKHCYPRTEVYNKWIESPNYVYSSNGKVISGKDNCLHLFDIGKNTTEEQLENNWYIISNKAIAVIDRDNKNICISTKYKYYRELVHNVPDDYQIFYCNNNIPTYNILSFSDENKEWLCKSHLKYIISKYVELYLIPFYEALHCRTTLHVDIDSIGSMSSSSFNLLNGISGFVRKYKVRKYNWYKESLNCDSKFKLTLSNNYGYKTIAMDLPSVKRVLTRTVFTKEQKDYLRKRYFYTKYCYGRGISFKDVDKYYGKVVRRINGYSPSLLPDLDYKDIKKLFESCNIYWLDDYCDDSLYTWNDYIIKSKQIEDNIHKKIKEEQERYKQQLINNKKKTIKLKLK